MDINSFLFEPDTFLYHDANYFDDIYQDKEDKELFNQLLSNFEEKDINNEKI